MNILWFSNPYFLLFVRIGCLWYAYISDDIFGRQVVHNTFTDHNIRRYNPRQNKQHPSLDPDRHRPCSNQTQTHISILGRPNFVDSKRKIPFAPPLRCLLGYIHHISISFKRIFEVACRVWMSETCRAIAVTPVADYSYFSRVEPPGGEMRNYPAHIAVRCFRLVGLLKRRLIRRLPRHLSMADIVL